MTRWQIEFMDLLYFIFSTTKQNIVQINSQSKKKKKNSQKNKIKVKIAIISLIFLRAKHKQYRVYLFIWALNLKAQ